MHHLCSASCQATQVSCMQKFWRVCLHRQESTALDPGTQLVLWLIVYDVWASPAQSQNDIWIFFFFACLNFRATQLLETRMTLCRVQTRGHIHNSLTPRVTIPNVRFTWGGPRGDLVTQYSGNESQKLGFSTHNDAHMDETLSPKLRSLQLRENKNNSIN